MALKDNKVYRVARITVPVVLAFVVVMTLWIWTLTQIQIQDLDPVCEVACFEYGYPHGEAGSWTDLLVPGEGEPFTCHCQHQTVLVNTTLNIDFIVGQRGLYMGLNQSPRPFPFRDENTKRALEAMRTK